MKFVEKHDKLPTRRPTEEREAERAGTEQRRKERLAKLEEFWATVELTPEDEALMAAIQVPTSWAERAALATSLKQAGSRRRSHAEIAKILRCSKTTVTTLVNDPDGSRWGRRKTGVVHRPTSNGSRGVLAPPTTPLHKELRKRRGRRLTQTKLAEALGVDVEMVRAWESGEERPTPAQYAQIIQVLP